MKGTEKRHLLRKEEQAQTARATVAWPAKTDTGVLIRHTRHATKVPEKQESQWCTCVYFERSDPEERNKGGEGTVDCKMQRKFLERGHDSFIACM